MPANPHSSSRHASRRRPPQRWSRRGLHALAALLTLLGSVAGIGGSRLLPAASAAATVSLSTTGPATVLYGATSSVTMTASNAPGNDPLYNASFRAVLPAGVTWAGGSPAPSDTIANRPSAGQTTLLWSNIGDIQPGASLPVSFTVTHTPGNDNPANPIHAGSRSRSRPRCTRTRTRGTSPTSTSTAW